MPIPLYGFLKGDSIGLLVMANDHDTVEDVARKLQRAAHVRVTPRQQLEVRYKGKKLNLTDPVAQINFEVLERIDVTHSGEEYVFDNDSQG